MDEGFWVREVERTKNDKMGYDVLSNQIVNMFEKGIVDPVKVTRTALQNAASAASVILTTDVLVTDLPEEKEKTPPSPSTPPGMGY